MKLKLALILGGTALAVPIIVGTTVAVVQNNSFSSNGVVDNNNGTIGDNNQGQDTNKPDNGDNDQNQDNQKPDNGNGNDQNGGNNQNPDNGNDNNQTNPEPEKVIASYQNISSNESIKIKKLDVASMNEYVNKYLSTFKSKIEANSTSQNITVDSFDSTKTQYQNNVFTLVFNVSPKQNAEWSDKTNVTKQLTLTLTNVSLSDELVATMGETNLTYTNQITLNKATNDLVNSYIESNLNTFKTFILNQNNYRNVDVTTFNKNETKLENGKYNISFSVAPKNGFFWNNQETTAKKVNVVLNNVVDQALVKEQQNVANFHTQMNKSTWIKSDFIKSLIQKRYFDSNNKQDRVDFAAKLLGTSLYFKETLPKDSGVAYRNFWVNGGSLIADTYKDENISDWIISTSNIDDIQLVTYDANTISFKITFKNLKKDSDGFYGYIAQASNPVYYRGTAMYPSIPIMSNTMNVKLNTKFLYSVNGVAGNNTYYDNLDQFYTDAAKTKTGAQNSNYIHIGLGMIRNDNAKDGYDLLFSGRVKYGNDVQLKQNGYIIEIDSNDGSNPTFNSWAWKNITRFFTLFCINDTKW